MADGNAQKAVGLAAGRVQFYRCEVTTDPRIRHVATACPKCGELLDCSEDPVNGATPSEGDATICAYCLTWLVFDRALVLHLCDLDSLPAHDRAKLKSIQRRIAERRPS